MQDFCCFHEGFVHKSKSPVSFQPRDLWSAGRREKDGKEKAEEEEDEDDMVGGGGRDEEEEEDDDGGGEDPAVAMTARVERRAARRARRASAPAVTTSTPTTTFMPAPSQWSVEEVTAFIHTLPGKHELLLGRLNQSCGFDLRQNAAS